MKIKLVITLMEQFLGKFGFAAMRHSRIVAQKLSYADISLTIILKTEYERGTDDYSTMGFESPFGPRLLRIL
jgi:hypothetical protein